jgi:hypothetical protein
LNKYQYDHKKIKNNFKARQNNQTGHADRLKAIVALYNESSEYSSTQQSLIDFNTG